MSDAQTGQDSGRWQKLMLVGILVVNLCLYGMVFVWARGGRSSSKAPQLTAGESLELSEAHRQSLALALSWQPDVQLVGATASWQLASGERLTLSRPAWSFSFYSPSTRQIQIVTVDRNGAQAGPLQRVDTAPQYVSLDWNLDGDDLLLTFLSHGGNEFIGAHPKANIHLQLKGEDQARSTWYVIAVDPAARQSLIVGIDALSRQVVMSN
jgi:hypothetical protein